MTRSVAEEPDNQSRRLTHHTGDVVADRFVIERRAGAGGMAVIYRAYDRVSNRVVALKELLAPDEELNARFLQEALLLARVRHPYVVGYVDHGVTADDVAYLAMEWLDGEDLATRISRYRFSVTEAVQLLAKISRGVGALHALSVVHRDIKPENIFLVEGNLEQPRVIDLGIALPLDGPRFITAPGFNVGTPAYMAPEQIRAERVVTPAADVYSLGCVLFACITGRLPFVAQHGVAMMVKALFDEAPRLQSIIPGVPYEVDELCARLLAKTPETRPTTANDLALEIEQISRRPMTTTAFVETIVPALTDKERELISVVVASPPPGTMKFGLDSIPREPMLGPDVEMATSAASPDDIAQIEMLHSLAELYGARVEVLRDGSLAAVMAANRSPSDMATIAARCAIALRSIREGMRVALATGWDVMGGRQPLGRVVDCAVAMLRAPTKASVVKPSEGHILIDAMTAALLGDRFVITEGGAYPVLVDERSADFEAWNGVDERTPFLGRGRETAELIRLFERTHESNCAQIALITGEAGLGKSRLCREVLTDVQSRFWPITILQADGDVISAGSPLGHLRRMCRAAANILEGESQGIQRQRLGAWIARHVPPQDRQRITEFVGEAVGIRFRDNPSPELSAAIVDGVLMGDQVRRAFVDLIRAECSAGPVILVLEDLQWGDAATVDCIDTLLRLAPKLPLLVLALARAEVHHVFPGLFANRAPMVLQVEPLAQSVAHELIEQQLGSMATNALVAKIAERSQGNAFYMLELVRAAREGRMSDTPLSVLAMTQRRLSNLEPDARRVLRAAGILGHVFWNRAVEALVNLEATMVQSILDTFDRDKLIVRRSHSSFRGNTEYAFNDALVREAAYVMLTDEDRRLGHRLAGEWLSSVGETDAVVLATHYDRGGASEMACRLYETAAAQSLAAGDFAAVTDLCARSITCGATGPVLGAVRRLQAEIAVWRGDFSAGAHLGAEAMSLLPSETPSWYMAASTVAWAALAIGDQEQLLGVAGELIGRIDNDSPNTAQYVVFARVAAGLYRSGHSELAEKLIDALTRGGIEQREIPSVAANLEEAAGWRVMFTGDRASAYDHFHESAIGFARAGDVRNQLRVGSNAAALRMMLGEYEEAATELRHLHTLADRLELKNVSANIEQNLGLALMHLGALQEARMLQERAIDCFVAQGDRGLESAARAYLAMILVHLGKYGEAEQQALEAFAVATSAPAFGCMALATLADLKRKQKEIDIAYTYAKEAMDLLEQQGTIEEGEALVRLAYIECLIELAELERASDELQKACSRLEADAVKIADQRRRTRFLQAIAEHKRLIELGVQIRGPKAIAVELQLKDVKPTPRV